MKEINDENNFCQPKLFNDLMNIFGWQLKEFKTVQDLAVVRADFYPVGHLLAISKKAVVICDGESEFIYNGNTYTDFNDLYSEIGDKAYNTFPDWEVIIEKQWAVKRNGQWVSAFTNIKEMPTTKQIRC